MANVRPTRSVPPDPPEAGTNDLPLDHALALLLADETENALRWGAAVLESGPWTPSALVVTARLLDQMGRRRAAIEGLRLAVQLAIAEGNLPLAMAATGDLRGLGAEVEQPLDAIANAFCQGSDRLRDIQAEPLLPQLGEFRPLSPFLTGPALATKAAQILETVRQTEDEVDDTSPTRLVPLPLFSALGKEALHNLLAAFETVTVPAGHAVIREGEEEAAAYIVARGELEVSRRSAEENGKPLVLARLASGAFFGEMALLSQLPGAASVTATRPSILLVAKRDALEEVVERHPEVAVELAAHCRRQAVANLGWASPVVVAIPQAERAKLVEHFETRMFDAGDKLVEAGEEARGLHLIVSGEIAVVAYEGDERVVLATLSAGETVGEVELVLCRNAAADATAVRPTATLFLPREEFFSLVQDHPALLHGLYAIAVRRHTETTLALSAGTSSMGEDSLLGDGDPLPPDLTALVEDVRPYAEPNVEPQRITPLARGTLALPRVSTPPLRNAPASPLPPPPGPSSSRGSQPPPRSATQSRVASGRATVPPPVPQSARPTDTMPGVGAAVAAAAGAVPSVAPVAASPRAKEKPSPTTSQMLGGVALVAAAALAVVMLRGPTESERPPAAATVLAPANPATAAAIAPWTAVAPLPAAPSAPASSTPVEKSRPVVTKPKISAPAASVKVHVEPTPVPAITAAASVSVVTTPSEAAALAPPSREPFAQPKAAASNTLSAGEFGGRE